MKIKYFPTIYEDELFYSALCRWFVHEGHFSFRCVQKEIFRLPLERPDINFINALTEEMQDAVLQKASIEELATEHTMFPYYARFLPKEKMVLAWDNLINLRGQNGGYMCMPVLPYKRKRYLRVCPLCMQEDRDRLGEAYYHRKHQIYGADVCHIHGCYLHESNTISSSKAGMEFVPAETILCKDRTMGNENEKDFTKYVVQLLDLPMDFNASESLWNYIKGHLNLKGYLLGSRCTINNKKITDDLSDFYSEKGIDIIYVIENIIMAAKEPLHSNVMRTCYLAYFLGIPVNELTVCHELVSLEEQFTKELTKLIHEGCGYGEIAERMNTSRRSVIVACNHLGLESVYSQNKEEREQIFRVRLQHERKFWVKIQKEHPDMNLTSLYKMDEYRTHIKWMQRNDLAWMHKHYQNRQVRKQTGRDWHKEDTENLPKVKSIIDEMYASDTRPCKVNYETVMKQLGYYGYMIKYLPMCRTEIDKHKESYQEYWAREAVYAVKKIQEEGLHMCYSRILKMISLDRNKIKECLPFVKDSEVAGILAELIKDDSLC